MIPLVGVYQIENTKNYVLAYIIYVGNVFMYFDKYWFVFVFLGVLHNEAQ